MGQFFYTFFLKLYPLGISIAALWNDKAKKWKRGRKKFPSVNADNKNGSVWMHCASLGEFEQGLPVLEKIKAAYPHYKIVITFFSPSGYEIRKNYKGADHIFYLPIDSPEHAKIFVELIDPKIVLWVKYEYWFYYLRELKNKNIPVLLISGAFRKDQPFFNWYGKLWKKMLEFFTHFFLQNQQSMDLLQNLDFKNISLSGDTRFDRVITVAENFTEVLAIKEFCGANKVIVAGSTWEDDEAELIHYVKTHPEIKFIIAPHEVDKENINDVRKAFAGSVLYSEWITNRENISEKLQPNCLIINNIGILSRLYKYADVTYVGGGFGDDGLHNILEAAVYGKPVIFGPAFEKNAEAEELIDCGGAITIENALDLEKVLNELFSDEAELKNAGTASKDYVYSKAGASKKIMEFIQENRLLTN